MNSDECQRLIIKWSRKASDVLAAIYRENVLNKGRYWSNKPSSHIIPFTH